VKRAGSGRLVGIGWAYSCRVIGLQLYSGLLVLVSSTYGSSFGYFAHVGGFIAGAVLAWLFPSRPRAVADSQGAV
jgi:membrane associated rhomboid family serine protease